MSAPDAEVMERMVASYCERIRAGEVTPWIEGDTEAERARDSAKVAREALALRTPGASTLRALARAWEDRAATLEADGR